MLSTCWKVCLPAFVLFSFLYSPRALATHAVGSDLTYECLGNNQYRITFNFYRDCIGSNAPSQANIDIVGCGSFLNVNLPLIRSKEVTSLCPAEIANSSCNGGNLPGIEQYIYSTVVTLPTQCANWVLSFTYCCRNAAITNLVSPSSRDMYVEATLNNMNGLCDNSPVFTTLPVPYICVNQKINYNHGAIDIDGDSLHYTSIGPRHSPTTIIPYSNGTFNTGRPLSVTGNFFLDGATGQLVFTPNITQNAVITIRVDEYRNGVLIGSTLRDMQFVVIPCTNNLPTATGINGTGGFVRNVCRNQPNCFDIFTDDIDATQNVIITWNNAIPGATFTTDGMPRPKGTFCWTPGPQHSGSYTFLAEVRDNACPLYGQNVYAYTLHVMDGITNTLATTPLSCAGGSNATATVIVSGGSGNYNYQWSTVPVQNGPMATGLSEGTYYVTMTDPLGCGNIIDTVLITAPPPIAIAPNITHADCGVSNGAIALTVSGGTGSTYNYQWNPPQSGGSISSLAGGWYKVTVTDSLLCTMADSCFVRQVNNSPNVVVPVAICAGESHVAGGAPQTVGGIYYDTLLNAVGCDSVIETHLAVLPHSDTTLTVSICQGDSILAGGIFRTQSGIYYDTLAAANTCDSVVITNLTVLPAFTTALQITICNGQTYFVGGDFQNTAGIYTDSFARPNGCDSVVITTLTVQVVTIDTFAFSICPGDSVAVNGGHVQQPGYYPDTLLSSNNCDSIIVAQVIALSTSGSSRQLSICQGDTITLGGMLRTQSGIYYDTLVGANGCDSVVTTQLTVNPHAATTVTVSICAGETHVAGGAPQSQSGTYYDTLIAANGCDSVITTQLTVLPHSYTTRLIVICTGDSLLAGGAYQKLPGTYYDTLLAANGCDSVVTTVLDVLSVLTTLLQVDICDGESHFAGGALQTTSGIYVDSFLSSSSCDSVVTTELTVHINHVVNDTITICSRDSAFLDGAFQQTAGTYYDSLLNAAGCDSVVVTQLFVVPYILGSRAVTICANDSFFTEGAYQNTAGIYHDTIIPVVGCDSIIEVTLSVEPVYADTVQITICADDSVLAGGAFQNTTGFYFDTLLTTAGCDSVIVTDLTVNPVYQIQIPETICAGDSFLAGGSYQTASGSYYDTLATAQSCDSVIVTQLTVINRVYTTVPIAICLGDSALAGGAQQTTSGTYYDTLVAATTCDSVVITQLTVVPPVTTTLPFHICSGDSVLAGGSYQHVSGTYYDTLLSSRNCDSIVVSQLTVHQPVTTPLQQTICSNDSVFVGGAYQTTAGVYYDTLRSFYNCDSILQTTLSVAQVFRLNVADSICDGDSILLGGEYRYSSGVFPDTALGTTTCDTIFTVDLTVLAVTPPHGENFTICADDSVLLEADAGYVSYLWSYQNATTPSIHARPGAYQLTVSDVNGCTSTADFTVDAHPLIELYITPDSATVLDGDTILLQALSGNNVNLSSYLWSPSAALNCDNCPEVILYPEFDELYQVIAMDGHDCPDTAYAYIAIDKSPRLYAPNAFTPDGDGVNDYFLVNIAEWANFRIRIFDRWGEKVFETTDPFVGWDGTYRGEALLPGVFVYYVDAKFHGGDRPADYAYYYKGSITLIR